MSLDRTKYIGSTRQTLDLDGFGIFLVLQQISPFSIVHATTIYSDPISVLSFNFL